MKLALLVLLAGCLDEPEQPPGFGYEMNDRALVTDVDGDGFDDVVTWGHDGDPRVDSQVFVRWGGQVPLSADANVTVSIPAQIHARFHETVVVMQPTLLAMRSLFALSCDGNAPQDPPSNRICQLWKLPISGRMIGDPQPLFTQQFDTYGFGGFTTTPAPVFVAEYEKTAGDPRMIVGDHDRLLEGPLGGDISDVQYTAPTPSEKLMDIVSAPPVGGQTQEELLYVTSAHAGIIPEPPIDASTGKPLFDSGDPAQVKWRDIGGVQGVVAPANSTTLTWMHVFNGTELQLVDIHVPMPPQQLAIAAIGGYSLVHIDPTGLLVDENLDTGTGTFAATAGPIETESETVLAVGKFDSSGSDIIMIFDATDKSHAPKCFHVVSGALGAC